MTTVEEKSIFEKWVEDNVFKNWEDWEYTDFRIIDEEAKRMAGELEKMFTTLETKVREEERQKVLEEVREAIDDNIRIEKMTHRVGSHSDDYGGESDFPCDCDELERKYKISALEGLKIRLAKLNQLKESHE